MEFLTTVGAFIIGFFLVFCVLFTINFIYAIVKAVREETALKDTVETLKTSFKLVYIEKTDGITFLYDQLTNNFIAQGRTDEEAWARAKERFPNKEFLVKGTNGNAVHVEIKAQ